MKGTMGELAGIQIILNPLLPPRTATFSKDLYEHFTGENCDNAVKRIKDIIGYPPPIEPMNPFVENPFERAVKDDPDS